MRRSLPSFEMLNPRNLRSSGRATALFLVDLQPQLVGQEPAHRGHHPFTGAAAANIDICDWVNDDQPYLFEIGNPPLLSLPYSVQTNDVPAYFEMTTSACSWV